MKKHTKKIEGLIICDVSDRIEHMLVFFDGYLFDQGVVHSYNMDAAKYQLARRDGTMTWGKKPVSFDKPKKVRVKITVETEE